MIARLNDTCLSALISVTCGFNGLLSTVCGNGGRAIHGREMKEKVGILRELQRAIITTREWSKQAIEGHVSTAFIVYLVNEGARLTV
jgi:hypothetical protein